MIERRPNKFLKGRPHFCRKKHCMFRDSSSLKVSTILLCSLLLSILFIYDGCICYSPHLCVVFLFLILYPGLLLRRLLLQPPPHTHNTHTPPAASTHTHRQHTPPAASTHTHNTHTNTHTHLQPPPHTHNTHLQPPPHTQHTHTNTYTHTTTHTHQHTHTTHTHKHKHTHTNTHTHTTTHTHTPTHTHTAGVAQTHIYRRFAWQAWHLLRGRRGTYGTGWRPWARFRRA